MPHRTRGFSLVELLVVLGIIMILLGIILPGLIAAKRSVESELVAGNNDILSRRGLSMQMAGTCDLNGTPSGEVTIDHVGPSEAYGTNAANGRMWVYTGIFYDEDGVVSFYENIDDRARVTVDGSQVINNTSWNTPTSSGALNLGPGPFANAPGWHEIELRFSDCGGGGLRVGSVGFGWDPTGAAGGSTVEGDYQRMNNSPGQYDVTLAMTATDVASLGPDGIPKLEDLQEGGRIWKYQQYQVDSLNRGSLSGQAFTPNLSYDFIDPSGG